jgi:hypothetical protein
MLTFRGASFNPPFVGHHPIKLCIIFLGGASTDREKGITMEVTRVLAALRPLYGKDNVEIITTDGRRVRGTVHSMKTTQALTTPSVKIQCASGEIIKIPFPAIAVIKDHND